MKQAIKALTYLVILILGIFQLSTLALAKTSIPSATDEFYVNDFAGVFTADEKVRLLDNAVALSDEHDGIQIVITTIASLNGNTIENYALEMYNQYGIGKNDMGLLILLSTSDREIRIETGLAMESYINDSKAGRFIDKFAIPHFKKDEFNEGLIALQEALISEVTTCISKENTDISVTKSGSKVTGKIIFISVFCVFIVAGLLVFIVLAVRNYLQLKKAKEAMDDTIRKCEQTIETLSFENEKKEHTIRQLERERNSLSTSLSNCKSRWQDEEKAIRADSDSKISSLQDELHTLKICNQELSAKLSQVQADFAILQDKYLRANKLYPTLDEEVLDMIEAEIRQVDMQKADEANQQINEVINLPADKNNINAFKSALSTYSSLSEKQKSYVTADITKLEQLYKDSVVLKKDYEDQLEQERIRKREEEYKNSANTAVQSISAIIALISVGTAKNLPDLKKARNLYDSLSFEARKYFDDSLLEKMNSLLKSAKDDFDREQKLEKDKKEAADAMNSINRIIGCISHGKAHDLYKLRDARSIYDRLSSDVRQHVNKSIIDDIERLTREAKRDEEEERRKKREADERRRREDEERRRRMQSSSFYSSSHSSSHHSGFGGRSGGGGTTRKF